ncbi:MAG: 2-C-methyl-D-erythritol 2,4-cyclodiphosphate synthase, partial [Candidatus Omnitrophica bacterium]|nr:2-C-methyl-D-erythritol 2,4-cyclodiphosphate synthase [Candidatus Omnitrophota bacterium]
MLTYRSGIGYDVHRFSPGRPLFLGGIEIPYPLGLDGHSDADVILHAICDAVLGAAGQGDIGEHFPPGDPQ